MENKMNKLNRANGETAEMSASYSTSQGQAFGYVQPVRFVKSGKCPLVYRLPAADKQLAVSRTLVFLLVLFLAAFATGYANAGLVPDQSGRRIQPVSSVPVITFHRLITISAVQGAINFPVNTIPGDTA
jgi:hypothetical protein